MNVYVVWRLPEHEASSTLQHSPEGAFETEKLAREYIADRLKESNDRGHAVTKLELIRVTDRPSAQVVGYGE